MKKFLLLASLLTACAVSSFAQSPANDAGAKLVAERDAAYAKAHPVAMKDAAPVGHHTNKHHTNKHHTKHHSHIASKAAK